MRFVCIGDCGVDRYHGPYAGDRPGGCTLNVATHLSSLMSGNDELHVVSAVGDDPAGALVRRALASPGATRSTLVRVVPGSTPVQNIRLAADGERTFIGYEPGVLASFVPDVEQEALLESADWTMTVAFTQIMPLVQHVLALPRRGKLAVDFMDMADFGGRAERLDPFLGRVDLAFFGLRSEADQGLINALRRRAYGKIFVVTLGADGAVAFRDEQVARVDAVSVKVVDTTGAGDAFAAACLARLAAGAGLDAALVAGAERAAAVVGRVGGM